MAHLLYILQCDNCCTCTEQKWKQLKTNFNNTTCSAIKCEDWCNCCKKHIYSMLRRVCCRNEEVKRRNSGRAGGWHCWRQSKLTLNRKIFTSYASFCTAAVSSIKRIKKIIENHSEFSVWANSRNKLFKVYLDQPWNYQWYCY